MTLFDRKTAQVVATLLAFAAGLWLLWGLRELFFLLVLAMLAAYTVEPIIRYLQRLSPRHISRRTAIVGTCISGFLLVGFAAVVLGEMVSRQAAELIGKLPSLSEDPSRSVALPLPSQLEPFRDELMRYGVEFVHSAASGLVGGLGSFGLYLLVPVFAIFFLKDGSFFRHAMVRFAGRFGEGIWVTGLLTDLSDLLSRYIRAVLLQSLAVFVGYAIFYQATQVPYAMLLATLAALLEVIPVLGWISAAAASLVVVLFAGYTHWAWLVVFYLVFRVIQDYVITPYLMQNGIEIPAFLVLAGVIGGELLGGIRGMFLSIPLIAVVRILYRHWVKRGVVLSLVLVASMAEAHSISVSTSEGTLSQKLLELRVHLPRYEVEHLPQAGLMASIVFTGASLKASDCTPDKTELLCVLSFEFAQVPGEQIGAEVKLARVTVPNHVHIMKVTRGEVTRQAVFDRTFEQERIDFHESGKAEVWWRAARMGFVQLAYQPILILLLLILSRPLAYGAGAAAAFLVVLPDRFYATPGFFELATAISLSYVACEHLFFPAAGGKWLVAATIGAIEGAAMAILARPTGQGAVAFGAGNLIAAMGVSFLALRFLRNIPEVWLRKIYWALAGLGVIWSIWVFVKRF